MIKSVHGITKEPFSRSSLPLLPQQKDMLDIIKIHAQQGGFSVITGLPGVGKSVLAEYIQSLGESRDTTVASCTRTMHSYLGILKQLADALKIEASVNHIENELIKVAFGHVRARKTLYIIIDEAHLLETAVLRKLRLLFEQFPKKHNLVLFGQMELFHQLTMVVNQDIKSRITYSATIHPLNDDDMANYILDSLAAVRMGANTFDEAATELIIRSAQGNLRLCRNLCYGSLVEAAIETKKAVTIAHVNAVLIQPHWRTHDQLIKQQVKPDTK